MVALTINSNLASDNSQRALEFNRSQLGQSITRLASGVKIKSALDGSAELSLSENIRSDVRALKQGSRNLNDGLSMIRTAESGLTEISTIFIRLRQLASQASNGTIGDDERHSADLEYQNLLRELDRISNATEFRETSLLNGGLAKTASEHIVIQVGTTSASENQFDLNQELNLTEISRKALNLENSNIKSQGSALLALNDLTVAISDLIDLRARVGKTQIRMTHALQALSSQIESLSKAVSTIKDTDIAEELAILTKNQLLVQAGAAMVGQANLIPQAVLTLFEGVQ